MDKLTQYAIDHRDPRTLQEAVAFFDSLYQTPWVQASIAARHRREEANGTVVLRESIAPEAVQRATAVLCAIRGTYMPPPVDGWVPTEATATEAHGVLTNAWHAGTLR